MGRHLLRDQQPVRAWVLLVCLVVAAVALALLFGGGGEAGEGSASSDVADEADGSVAGGSVRGTSSSGRWLDELASSREGSPTVSWTEERGLVEVSTSVLERYECVEGVRLMTSGYLDIEGNVWGAILSDRKGWVDMVTVMADDDDGKATVRVVRLLADGDS